MSVRLLVALLAALGAGPALAQSTRYYVTDGDDAAMFLVESGVLRDTVTTWFFAYPLAVRETVMLAEITDNEVREYTLAGVPTGRTFLGNGAFVQVVDGTTDGVQFNYGIECCGDTNSVVVTDLNWENSRELFSIPYFGQGIAYDTRTHRLFTSELNKTMIHEYDLAGNELNSFEVFYRGDPLSLLGLAYEQTTDTLWGKELGKGTLYQISKTGTLLDVVVVPGLDPRNDFGGEMRIRPMIDFESLAHEDDRTVFHGSSYQEDGFTITGPVLSTYGTLDPRYTGSTALFDDAIGAQNVLTKSDGGAFDLISVDLAELEGNQSPGATVEFTGVKRSGRTISQSFQLDGVAFGAEPFVFSSDFRGLTSVRWTQGAQQVDNIVVPEPAWSLLQATALWVLAVLRARRRARRSTGNAAMPNL